MRIIPRILCKQKQDYDEVLPWDHIDVGVSKKFLVRESKKAHVGDLTGNCTAICSKCGAQSFKTGICTQIRRRVSYDD